MQHRFFGTLAPVARTDISCFDPPLPSVRTAYATRLVQGAPRRCRASGRLGAELKDGTVLDIGPDDVYDIPPEHDGYTIGDEPCVLLEWSGLRAFLGFRAEWHGRILTTLL
jgi:hypothetical protein